MTLNKNILTYFFMISLIHFLVPHVCTGQSTKNLEMSFENLQQSLMLNNTKLDSLKTILNKRAQLIEKYKNDPNVNEDEIIVLMANSVSISNEVKFQSRLVDKLNRDISTIKSKLFRKYSGILDSLKNLQSNEKNDQIILQFTEKKLRVSPKIGSLSFDPAKLLDINFTKNVNSFEKKILNEYLTDALKEVDTYLSRIKDENAEVEEIFTLQRKTQRFLEEAEFNRSSQPIDIVTSESPANEMFNRPDTDGETFSGGGSQTGIMFIPHLETYSKILSQLSFINPSTGLDWQTAIDSAKENLSLPDYKIFLDELKLRLEEYKLILSNKQLQLNE